MLDRGVFLAPSGYETMFVSLAHTDADIDATIDAAVEAARATSSEPTLSARRRATAVVVLRQTGCGARGP